jgi:SAM-dependent methyltransferase
MEDARVEMNLKNSLTRTKNLARRIYNRSRACQSVESEQIIDDRANDFSKREKLSRIASYLICPRCRAQLDHTKFQCEGCGQIYNHTVNHFNFLTEEHKKEFKIVETQNVAANEYDEIASGIIEKYSDGLVLDCGAGKHSVDHPTVIYYELVDYPSTDVLGVGESLPFQDETFDAVFSLNVLEHTADPFRCAREISRVLKKNGTLYCVAPFLQPVHAYPNHFYNMSGQGLRNLFEANFEIIEHKVPLSGVPFWTLNWFLASWINGLEGKTREEFLNMTVRELTVEEPLKYLQRDFVTELSTEKNFELACTTMLLCKKN